LLISIEGESGVGVGGTGVGGIAVGGTSVWVGTGVAGIEVLVGTAVWVDTTTTGVRVGGSDSSTGTSLPGEQADNTMSVKSKNIAVFINHSLAMEFTGKRQRLMALYPLVIPNLF
jgi:hypothetical protein